MLMIQKSDLPEKLQKRLGQQEILFAYQSKIRRLPNALDRLIGSVIFILFTLVILVLFLWGLKTQGVVHYTFNGMKMTAQYDSFKSLIFPITIISVFLWIGISSLIRYYPYFIKDDIIYAITNKGVSYFYKGKVKFYDWFFFDNVTLANETFRQAVILHFKNPRQVDSKADDIDKAELFLTNPPDLYALYHIIKERI